ncbi:MBL fold metallo-hydrolase [Paeniglutamicibacter sp. ZC-3]|uniref:MBL fold metallo-hydrolase n=1 Tax=Paeniglutamicibacter sp. ZC-3 TaxID=2986919 RepID=UPI0021F7873C|nr:MBL fold metallo-hydrolase [Paeniglutamicibacter sp. ZC-3]MCV9994303.1 MBL fold metallo-hydrolase [Paeniglutamicibacter sp. ZC-3]
MSGWNIGRHSIVPLLDGHGHEPAREVLERVGYEGDPWACHSHLLDGHGNLAMEVGGYLIRSGDRTVVVDAGVGRIDNGKYRGGQFLESLREQGLEPQDVTDVVFTHLHFDHVGWATRSGQVVFPKATYRVHKADWEHFVESDTADPGAVRKLSPLREQLETFSGEHTIAPGIDALPVVGHTPGSSAIVLSDQGSTGVLIGDLAHAYIELTEPGWEYVHDVLPEQAIQARTGFVENFADTGTAIFGAHFPGMRPGTIESQAGVRTWKQL